MMVATGVIDGLGVEVTTGAQALIIRAIISKVNGFFIVFSLLGMTNGGDIKFR